MLKVDFNQVINQKCALQESDLNMKLDTDIKEIDQCKLEKFIFNHPYGNFYQSTKIYRFLQSVDNYDPILIVASEGDAIVGSILGVIVKEGRGIKGFFSRRAIVWGGPVVQEDDPDIWASLLKELNHLISKKAIYTEIRNFRDQTNNKTLFIKADYQHYEHLNYIVTISFLDQVRAGLSKSKYRQIKKSLKSGAEIVQPESIEELKCFYEILQKLYKEKIHKPLPPFDFFSKFFHDKTLGRFLLIQYKGQIIGGIMCPIYKDTIYEWFVCGKDSEIRDVYPSVLATWAPMEYGANIGLKYFDFMGAGKPDQDYGVREFKSKFGGELVNFGRFVRVNQKMHYQIGKMGLLILKRVK